MELRGRHDTRLTLEHFSLPCSNYLGNNGHSGWSVVSLRRHFVQKVLSCRFHSLARLFSRLLMSASPSSALLPRAVHSRNSTLIGSWLNSKSLPFLPKNTLPPTEPSWELRAAERVTLRVFLQKQRNCYYKILPFWGKSLALS